MKTRLEGLKVRLEGKACSFQATVLNILQVQINKRTMEIEYEKQSLLFIPNAIKLEVLNEKEDLAVSFSLK